MTESRDYFPLSVIFLVGVKGLEPPASCSQSRRATSCATPGYVLFSAAACVCTHFKRKRRFLPHPFSVIPLSSRVRFQTAQAANLYILQFA